MKRILEYDLISERYHDDFVFAVNRQIAEGWQPYRGVFTTGTKEYWYLNQVVVRYEE